MSIKKKYWDVLDKANFVGEELCQGKRDYKTSGIVYGLFFAPKTKYCLTIADIGIIQKQKRLKDSTIVNCYKTVLNTLK